MTDRPNIIDVLYDMGDGELIESWQRAETEYRRALQVFRAHEAELIRRMGDRLALESDKGTVVRSPKLGAYQWDRDALHRLFGERLTREMWAEIETPVTTIKTRTTSVHKYAKRLGITEEELKQCYFRAEQSQDLEFYPPQDLLAELEASVEKVKAEKEAANGRV